MASLFKSLSEDMEKIAQVVEEGTKIIMGTSEHMGDASTGQSNVADVYDEEGFSEDDQDMDSPLMGMADSVLSDIMANQVSSCIIYFGYHQCKCKQNECVNNILSSTHHRILDHSRQWKIYKHSLRQSHGTNHSLSAF